MTMVAGVNGSRVQVQDDLQSADQRSLVGRRLHALAQTAGDGELVFTLSDRHAIGVRRGLLTELAECTSTRARVQLLVASGLTEARAGDFLSTLPTASFQRVAARSAGATPQMPAPAATRTPTRAATAAVPQPPASNPSASVSARSVNQWLGQCDAMGGQLRFYIPMSHGRAPVQFGLPPSTLQRASLAEIRQELRAQISQHLNGHALATDPAEDARRLDQLVDSSLSAMMRGFRGSWNDLANASPRYVVINPVARHIRVSEETRTTASY